MTKISLDAFCVECLALNARALRGISGFRDARGKERCLQHEVSLQRALAAASAFGGKECAFRAQVGVQTGFRVPRWHEPAEGAGNINPRSRGNQSIKSAREPHSVGRGAELCSLWKPRYSGPSD